MTETKPDTCIACDTITELRRGRCIDCWQRISSEHSKKVNDLRRRALTYERACDEHRDEILRLNQLLAAKETALQSLTGAAHLDGVEVP